MLQVSPVPALPTLALRLTAVHSTTSTQRWWGVGLSDPEQENYYLLEEVFVMAEFKINSMFFQRMLEAVAIAASKGSALPALASVHLKGDGSRLVMEATDRYRIHKGCIEYEGDPFEVIIPASVAADVKRAKPVGATWAGSVEGYVFTVEGRVKGDAYYSQSFSAIEYAYPDLGKLFKSDYQPGLLGDSWNPAYIADLHKVQRALKLREAVSFWSELENPGKKPCVATFGGHDDFIALLMPVRAGADDNDHRTRPGTVLEAFEGKTV